MWASLGVTFITEFSSSAEVFGNRFGSENVNSVTSNIVGCNGLFLGAFCMYMLVVVPAQLVFVESNGGKTKRSCLFFGNSLSSYQQLLH